MNDTLPPLPNWVFCDDLGGLVPSEIRSAMVAYAREALAAYDAEQEPCHDAWRAALAQHREPLTASQVNELCNECHLDWHRGWSLDEEPNRYLELARAIEKHHGIGATTGKEPGNV